MEYNIDRAKQFKDKHSYQESSGFWLSTDQLLQLALDLAKQGSSGIGFCVGYHDDKKNNIDKSGNILQWYSVEAIPLSGDIEKYEGGRTLLGNDISISEVSNKKVTNSEKIKGFINGNVAELFVHAHKDSNEAQRFPPPAP